jgi:type III pantothenate kinase
MLLAIDVGNTNIVLGVFDHHTLTYSWRLTTLRERTADEVGILLTQLFQHRGLDPASVTGIVMASVVPSLTPIMMTMGERYFGRTPLAVDQQARAGMPILYEQPAEVGADRIVNGIAAYEEYGRSAGRAVIVVDFGTATTFDVISSKGEYLGGVICPGIQISADALFQRTARLPRIEVNKPAHVIGRNTVESMRSGLFFGYVSMIEGLVARLRRELGEPAVCVATGGLAEVIAPETSVIEGVSPDLTLHGLRLFWERNQ